ncbi:hypothetical protein [Yonghaparkia sp. Root332]|uniref:hypothetical protein n=1 Tax=Yonghaparkia sp. Root332 TaxID=1736516 RepID=UPI0006F35D68|nr:hypothetical protein [Yonghaparkia sp. Root332]KQV26293.1 hypothetical protein ASC54_05170 [Yonghaparkia sp. Root332]
MTRTVAVVCGSGVSSTFLARGLRGAIAERSLDWRVEPLSVDELADRADDLDLVIVGQHLAAGVDAVTSALDGRAPSVVLDAPGTGPDAVASALAHLTAAPSAASSTTAPSEGEHHG